MDTYKIAQGKQIRLKFESHKEVSELLNQLHDYYDLSWPKIAKLPAINPPGADQIPFSTLANIAKTGIVPAKWRDHFSGVGAVDSRDRITIRKDNMKSSARTITKHLSLEKRLELIKLLAEDEEISAKIIIIELAAS